MQFSSYFWLLVCLDCLLLHFFYPGKRENLLDVIFVLGSSNLQFFQEYKNLALDILDSPQTSDTKYGYIKYDSKPKVVRGLRDFISKSDVAERLRNEPWSGIGSDLDGAIRKANDVFTKEGRLSARKLLVVYGDGPFDSDDGDLRDSRGTLVKGGVKVITVTFGDSDDDEKKLEIVTTTDKGPVRGNPEKPNEAKKKVTEEILKGI